MLGNAAKIFSRKVKAPPLQVRVGRDVRVFSSNFKIGRDESCEVRLDSSLASRVHAEIRFEDGTWVLRDAGSTNGTFVNGRRVTECLLRGETDVRIGEDGAKLTFVPEEDGRPKLPRREGPQATAPKTTPQLSKREEEVPIPSMHGRSERRKPDAKPPVRNTDRLDDHTSKSPPRRARTKKSARPLNSTQDFVHHYFAADDVEDGSAGERTRMIRRAYAQVERGNRRKLIWISGGAIGVCLLALGFVAWQQWQIDRIEDAFVDLRSQEAEIVRIRMALEERYDASLAEQLERLEEERARRRERFEGFVEEYGIRRELSEEEQVIFKVARIFNESHTNMPAPFVRAVRDQIRVWQTAARSTFVTSIRRSETEGYTAMIVRAMRENDLPPEFFYLALVESNFRHDAVGPATRFGYAKGMWQFIPETGEAYGLQSGPRVDDREYDENDDRHDPARSTEAAARYLRDIYGTLAQASGLLAMASYNWGEHRVVSKLDQLLEGIPDDPEARSYWRFYSVYSDRMPQETKDYVIKIFAAAVIGENPRMFGFEFDNPLEPYM